MSIKSRSGAQSQQSGVYNGQVWGQTTYGDVIPTVIGRCRTTPKMIWAANHRKYNSGKKLKQSKKKGSQQSYAQNIDFLIGSTPIEDLLAIWRNKDYYPVVFKSFTGTIVSFESGIDFLSITNMPSGNTAVGILGVTFDNPIDVEFTDWGAPAPFIFNGTSPLPFYQLSSLVPPVFSGFGFPPSIDIGKFPYPYVYEWAGTRTDPQITIFTGSLGSLAGTEVTVYYAYQKTSQIGLSLLNFIQEYWYPYRLATGDEYDPSWTDQQLNYYDVQGLGSAALDLGTADSIPTFGFETRGAFGLGQYSEANIADAFQYILGAGEFDPSRGAGDALCPNFQNNLALSDAIYRSAFTKTFLGDMSFLRNFSAAYDIGVSIYMDQQQDGRTWLQDLLDIANAVALWQGFELDIIPRCEVSAVGNGSVYTSPFSNGPIVDIGPEQFLTKKGAPPVVASRVNLLDAPNIVPIEHIDMDNQFNTAVTMWPNQLDIYQRGAYQDDVKTLHEIMRIPVAQRVASMIVNRSTQQRNTYKFTLPLQFEYLLPMDPITLTEPFIGLNKKPVILTKTTETETWELDCEAEDYIYGSNAPAAAAYASTTNTPILTNSPPGNVEDAVIFTMPSRLSTVGPGVVLGLACCSADPNWGGAAVFVSNDDVEYQLAGTIQAGNTVGRLTADYPSSPDPDASDTLAVDLSESNGSIQSATTTQRDQFASLAFVSGSGGGEIIAYATATLIGSGIYHLTPTIRRGVYGTTPEDHPTTSQFCLIDSTILQILVDQNWIGSTLYFKFCSFNTYGQLQQPEPSVTAFTFTPSGDGVPLPQYSINPQVVAQQPGGAPTTVVVSAFDAAFNTGTVHYLGATISIGTILVPTQLWITIQDPGQIGEAGGNPALTYFADTTPDRANEFGFTYCGTLIATGAGGVLATAGGSAGPR